MDRLLAALHSLPYRQDLAARISQKENISYKSAMRRLQRYITEAGEKRDITRTSAPKRQVLRAAARQVPVEIRRQATGGRRQEKAAPPPEPFGGTGPRPSFFKEIPAAEIPPSYIPYSEREDLRDIGAYDHWAIVAYHDGDAEETANNLGLSARSADLLQIATTGDGVDITGARGAGEIADAIRDFYADDEDAQDVEDFFDLLHNMPDWNIGLILEDIRSGETTFSDWIDGWHGDGMIYRAWGDPDDNNLEDSMFWALWRAAYARATT